VVWPLWAALVLLVFAYGQNLGPGPLRRWFASMYPDDTPTTHGSTHFGTAAIGARHLAPAAPADAFVLGYLPETADPLAGAAVDRRPAPGPAHDSGSPRFFKA
jgi:hypothetical protein